MNKKGLLALIVLSVLATSISIPVSAPLPTTLLGLCLDGSGSIDAFEFGTMINGVAEAIRNHLPHDGRVELVVVQFSTPFMARVEVPPTVIDSTATANAVAATVASISQIGGATPTADGLWLTWETMKTASTFDTADKKVINLATDGEPNYFLSFVPTPTWNAYTDAEWVVTQAVAQGLDELDAEGIGMTLTGLAWLRDDIVYPTGFEVPTANANPYDYDGDGVYDPGWVRDVDTFQEFADTIGEKFEIIVVQEEHDVEAVSQTAVETSVEPGTVVDVEVTVRNNGDFTETFDVTCYYDGTPIGTQSVHLGPGEYIIVTFTWDTTGVPLNEYLISAWADSGEAIVEVDELNNWCDMPLPIFVIPELPLGTVMAFVSMLAALALFKKRPIIQI